MKKLGNNFYQIKENINMADYVKKEDKALDAIASEICKLDNCTL